MIYFLLFMCRFMCRYLVQKVVFVFDVSVLDGPYLTPTVIERHSNCRLRMKNDTLLVRASRYSRFPSPSDVPAS